MLKTLVRGIRLGAIVVSNLTRPLMTAEYILEGMGINNTGAYRRCRTDTATVGLGIERDIRLTDTAYP